MADYTDVLAPAQDNPGGTKLAFYFAPLSTFDVIQKEGGIAAANLEDVAVISTDHTFKTGGRFYKVELELNKNELNSEYQGAVRGNADKFTFTGLIPNLSAAQEGLLRKARAEKHIVLVPLPDGQVVQLGEEDNGAMISSNFGTGTQEGGERGNTLSITAVHYKKLYTGAIPLVAAI